MPSDSYGMFAESRSPRRLSLWARFRLGLARFWHRMITSEWCGNRHVPNDHAAFRWDREGDKYRVAAWANDAFDLYVGWADSWETSIRRPIALRLAFWILWRWVWAEWFGLRRLLFYWDLDRRVRPYLSGSCQSGPGVIGRRRDA